jgi:hypothetical protein
MTPRRKITPLALLGWALLYSRHGNDWKVVAEFPLAWHCERALDGRVDEETQAEIGGALATQSGDNPLRQAAYARAVRHVRGRYRCDRDT